eukprot:SAG11_NODE_31784_length_289_cov_0.810526_1_plen_40_part_10
MSVSRIEVKRLDRAQGLTYHWHGLRHGSGSDAVAIGVQAY